MHVAYVDDDPLLLELTQCCLEQIPGVRVTCLDDAEAALNIMRSIDPDIVLLDVSMPGMTGIELMTALRDRQVVDNAPIILITAATEEQEVNDYKAAGADGVIAKPIMPGCLAEKLIRFSDAFRLRSN